MAAEAVPSAEAARPPRGRPPRADAERQILQATRELLAEGGVEGLTVEGAAERAGVAKTTIYRRYRSKQDLALAVLVDMIEHVASVPDLGDTRAELLAFVNRSAAILGQTLMGRVMRGIVSDLAADATLAAAFRERVIGRRLADIRLLVERGIERGQLRPDTDHQLVNELLLGPLYYRLLFSGTRLDRDFAERIVDTVLPAFASRP